jgi:iron complex transport system ATP-binding protein
MSSDFLGSVSVSNLTCSYGKNDLPILSDLSVKLPQNKITAIVGSNGSGKSTLLKTIARLLKPKSGIIKIDGKSISTLSTKEIAKRIAILPQGPDVPPGINVRELVSYGRNPYQNFIGTLSKEDIMHIEWSLRVTNLKDFEQRIVDTLSGGERQRVWIALALAQKTATLLLDEPTTYLDVHHQLEILSLIHALNRKYKITVGWVLHDLNNAASYSDYMIMIKDGKIFAEGPPSQIMTFENILKVFKVEVSIIHDPETRNIVCLPRRHNISYDI